MILFLNSDEKNLCQKKKCGNIQKIKNDGKKFRQNLKSMIDKSSEDQEDEVIEKDLLKTPPKKIQKWRKKGTFKQVFINAGMRLDHKYCLQWESKYLIMYFDLVNGPATRKSPRKRATNHVSEQEESWDEDENVLDYSSDDDTNEPEDLQESVNEKIELEKKIWKDAGRYLLWGLIRVLTET